jgi:5-methylcytosine-specific restriction endonuclease McrA
MCRLCRAAYKKVHYQANKQRYVDNATARRKRLGEERMQLIVDYLRTHPCVDCGEPDVLVLEFDHLGDKLCSISRGLLDRPLQAVLDEMAKCEVVCANCHRRRTATRGGFLRAAVAQR